MAVWKKLSAPTLGDMLDVLNGAQVGTVNIASGADVDGLTLIIDTTGTPRTVTFTAKGRLWTAVEIIEAINDAHADLADVAHLRRSPPGMSPAAWVVIWKDGGATIDKDGTGNELLGFSAAADQVQAVKANTAIQVLERDQASQGSWYAVVYE